MILTSNQYLTSLLVLIFFLCSAFPQIHQISNNNPIEANIHSQLQNETTPLSKSGSRPIEGISTNPGPLRNTDDGEEPENAHETQAQERYKLVTSIATGVFGLIVGSALLLCGIKSSRVIVFTTTFFVVLVLSSLAIMTILQGDSSSYEVQAPRFRFLTKNTETDWLIFVSASITLSLLVASMAFYFINQGIMFLGLAFGYAVGTLILSHFSIENEIKYDASIASICLIVGMITYFFKNVSIMMFTAYFGAIILMCGADTLIDCVHPNRIEIIYFEVNSKVNPALITSWIITLALAVFGYLFQYYIFIK